MLNEFGPAGASGQGFISGTAGPMLVLVAVAAVFALPAVREFVTGYFVGVRRHFTGDSAESAVPLSGAAAVDAASSEQTTVRASDRDEYDFDLDLLASGDACDVDASTAP